MTKRKVYYYDTDAGGVVYYGRYLFFLEEARTELLESKGVSIVKLAENGMLFAVTHADVKYKAPARYGDILDCQAKIKKLTAARIVFDQHIFNQSEQLLVEAEITLVCLTDGFKVSQIPDHIKQAING